MPNIEYSYLIYIPLVTSIEFWLLSLKCSLLKFIAQRFKEIRLHTAKLLVLEYIDCSDPLWVVHFFNSQKSFCHLPLITLYSMRSNGDYNYNVLVKFNTVTKVLDYVTTKTNFLILKLKTHTNIFEWLLFLKISIVNLPTQNVLGHYPSLPFPSCPCFTFLNLKFYFAILVLYSFKNNFSHFTS